MGLDYSNIHLRIGRNNLPFNKKNISDFKLLDLNIGYTKPFKNNWRLGIRLKPGFSSNLTICALSIEDIVFSGDIVFIKDKSKDENIEKPYRLIFGISNSQNRRRSFLFHYLL